MQLLHNLPIMLLGYATPHRLVVRTLARPRAPWLVASLLVTSLLVDPVLCRAFDHPAIPRTRPATPRIQPATLRTQPVTPHTKPATPCTRPANPRT